jgi:hypothetical protein
MAGIRNKILDLRGEPMVASDIDPGHAVRVIPGGDLTSPEQAACRVPEIARISVPKEYLARENALNRNKTRSRSQ